MSIMILEVLLQAAVLCTILRAVARYEADYSFQKVAMVAAGIALGNMAIQALLAAHVPVGWHHILIIPCVAFTAFMIMTFCWITIWKSLLVVAIFVAFQLASQMGIALLMNRYGPHPERQAAEVQKKQQEVAEMQKAIIDMINDQPSGGPPAHQAPAPAPPPVPASTVPHTQPQPHPVPGAAAEPTPRQKTPVSTRDGDQWSEAEKMINVTGISSHGGKYVALANNAVVAENDIVTVKHNDRIYRWRASEITRNGVKWERIDVTAR